MTKERKQPNIVVFCRDCQKTLYEGGGRFPRIDKLVARQTAYGHAKQRRHKVEVRIFERRIN